MTIDCSFDWSKIGNTVGPCLRPGGSALTQRALRVCSLSQNSCLADIGCGTGGTLKHLERAGFCNLTGIDYSEVLLAQAGGYLKSVQLIQGKAEDLPLKTNALDALFCECVLSILDNKVSAIHEFDRVLKFNSFLIISDIFRPCSSVQQEHASESKGVMSNDLPGKEGIIGLLSKSGFSLVLWEEHKKALKEFAARMILAGEHLPNLWGCRQDRKERKTDPLPISYFLLVARKQGHGFPAS
jgi:arsenite methyltransferase